MTDRDEKLDDRIYQMLEQRCPNTKIGKGALARRWFVQETGPWNHEQKAVHEALQKELGIAKQQE